MKWLDILMSIRKALGVLTDILNKGREAGYWREGHGPTRLVSEEKRKDILNG